MHGGQCRPHFFPEAKLPDYITRRALWGVAQSQYDLLGLLCVYMVKWKLLVRKVATKEISGGWESALNPEEEEEFRGLLNYKDKLRN